MGDGNGRQARFAAKHETILSAARDVFLRHGYSRASIDEIAGAAAVSTATVYRHFTSKEGLFTAVVAESLETIDPNLPGPGNDPLADLQALAEAYADLLSRPDTRQLIRMLIAETGSGGAMADAFYDAVKSQLSDLFVERLTTGIRAGVFRPVEQDMRAPVMGQLQGMIEHGTLLRGLVLGDDIDTGMTPAEIARDAMETWLANWKIS